MDALVSAYRGWFSAEDGDTGRDSSYSVVGSDEFSGWVLALRRAFPDANWKAIVSEIYSRYAWSEMRLALTRFAGPRSAQLHDGAAAYLRDGLWLLGFDIGDGGCYVVDIRGEGGVWFQPDGADGRENLEGPLASSMESLLQVELRLMTDLRRFLHSQALLDEPTLRIAIAEVDPVMGGPAWDWWRRQLLGLLY
ncbi:hypothetical protein [Sandaracinus amylolyticus]|uniref:hypothetical protein n=1 Tax=Sandaracinus amylolyticus TaxID=927083 RepID=UPI0012EE4348|nr:hypothetical protein [Sandaracinus amylolyticus]